MAPVIMWFRRDLRTADNPALVAALAEAQTGADGTVVPLFVVDPRLWGPAGAARREYLARSLAQLDRQLGGSLLVLRGDPVQIVPRVLARVGASSVHVSADHGPYGGARDAAVRQVLAGTGAALTGTGSGYAVSPGRIRKPEGEPFRVFAAYYRRWLEHGWRAPAAAAGPVDAFQRVDGGDPVPTVPPGERRAPDLPPAGEEAARDRWREFLARDVGGYHDLRDRPGADRTSRISVHLKWGELHPRTLLTDLASVPGPDREGAAAFRRELAFREFYADLLAYRPELARQSLDERWDRLAVDAGPRADELLVAWQRGLTGYPMVDAGMRQLWATGWMHNRVRMLVASFLVKDLHLDWRVGAQWFMTQLVDADLASNSQGWQWVAGAGTDAAPYYRVFNPTTQGKKFDPGGEYVHRWIPELRDVARRWIHEPWFDPHGYDLGYPHRIVDHANERTEALARWSATAPD